MADAQEAAQLSNAWGLHRAGNQPASIAAFNEILAAMPTHMDALYGLALAQRANGQQDAALESLQACRSQVSAALETDPGKDRYLMLQRFVQQRIAELKGRVAAVSPAQVAL